MHHRYFFSSNSGVDGCASKKEPGYEHMEWLRIQLQILRERGMNAILMGHVPPARVDSKESWDETCWQKYTLFMQQFRDVVVGGLYGHMNIDHFMLQDFSEISKDAKKGRMANGPRAQPPVAAVREVVPLLEDGEVTVASASDYLLDLREAWSQLPVRPAKSNKKKNGKSQRRSIWERFWPTQLPEDVDAAQSEKKNYFDEIGGKYAQRYAVSHVAPSVVPNYFPTLRIVEYNITGLEDMLIDTAAPYLPHPDIQGINKLHNDSDTDFDDDESYLRGIDAYLKKNKKHKKKGGKKKYKFKVPEGPSKSSPPGPAYSPQTLTWTRYVQYFANLTHINNDFVESQSALSDVGTSGQVLISTDRTSENELLPQSIFGLKISADGSIENNKWKEGKHGKHQGKRPRPEPHPNNFEFEIEYDTKEDKGFKDLTVRRWVEYARKIGRDKAKATNEIEDDVNLDSEDDEEDWLLVDPEDIQPHAFQQMNDRDYVSGDEDEDEDEIEEVDTQAAQGGKHKKKHNKKHRASKEWYVFARRAFVGTTDPHEIKALFGESVHQEGEEQMELK